jgi:glycerate kinase
LGIAGKVPLEPNEALNQYFDVLLAISNGPADIHTAMQLTRQNLVRTARQLGNLLALSGNISLKH